MDPQEGGNEKLQSQVHQTQTMTLESPSSLKVTQDSDDGAVAVLQRAVLHRQMKEKMGHLHKMSKAVSQRVLRSGRLQDIHLRVLLRWLEVLKQFFNNDVLSDYGTFTKLTSYS
jgi:hypothetical protein